MDYGFSKLSYNKIIIIEEDQDLPKFGRPSTNNATDSMRDQEIAYSNSHNSSISYVVNSSNPTSKSKVIVFRKGKVFKLNYDDESSDKDSASLQLPARSPKIELEDAQEQHSPEATVPEPILEKPKDLVVREKPA